MKKQFYAEISERNNDELEIISHVYLLTTYSNRTTILSKACLPWIINTLRTMTRDEYGVEHEAVNVFDEYRIMLDFREMNNRNSFNLAIIPFWNDRKKYQNSSAVQIPYCANFDPGHGQEMEYVEPFLKQLEQYVPEEERAKLVPPWPQFK